MKHLKHLTRSLALHTLADGDGTPLLLLHGAAGSSRDWPIEQLVWPGPVLALDFSGHGDSDRLVGGGYVPELFVADADHALAQLEEVALAGAGLGAYIALLLAGARPEQVAAALLLPGAGLDGGGGSPAERRELVVLAENLPSVDRADPLVGLVDTLVRPPEYVASFAAAARALVLAEDGGSRPPWWRELQGGSNVSVSDARLDSALAQMLAAI